MDCYIYHSRRRPGTYVYLTREEAFADLPSSIHDSLMPLEFSMTLTLDPARPLRKERVDAVIENLKSQGFHLQMPDDVESTLAALAARTQQGTDQ